MIAKLYVSVGLRLDTDRRSLSAGNVSKDVGRGCYVGWRGGKIRQGLADAALKGLIK